MNTGEKIKYYREKKGLTQSALSRKICCYPSTISMWEKGRYVPTIETISRMAKILEINPILLLPDWFINEVSSYGTP